MRRTTSQGVRQLLSSVPFKYISEAPYITRASHRCLRPFSNSANTAADIPTSPGSPSDVKNSPAVSREKELANLFQHLQDHRTQRTERKTLQSYNPTDASKIDYSEETDPEHPISLIDSVQNEARREPHHFHIYATRHNTHITVTTPERNPLISVSAGNIGFRKSGRKHYDSAFQLAGYVMGQMQERGITAQINRLEVVLRGFGAGREAVTKALLGSEGRLLRDRIVKVADSTRLKFGGTRGKKPRRLG